MVLMFLVIFRFGKSIKLFTTNKISYYQFFPFGFYFLTVSFRLVKTKLKLYIDTLLQ